MKAAILIVGNEILSGRTQDVNIQFIAERLSLRGIPITEVRIIGDDEASIVSAARALSETHDFVFSTGGIGPTHDDITADCMATAFNTKLEINADAKKIIGEYYAERGIDLNEGRLRMARIPVGAALIKNSISGAPGFKIKNVFVMAGVPKIMRAMFLSIESSLPMGTPLLSNMITGTLREGDIAVEMESIQKKYPDVEIGSYPTTGVGNVPSLSLVLRATDEKKLNKATDDLLDMVKRFDSDVVITYQRPS